MFHLIVFKVPYKNKVKDKMLTESGFIQTFMFFNSSSQNQLLNLTDAH